jgi:hypothetical protein
MTICLPSFCFVVCAAVTGCSDKKGDSADSKAQPANTAAVQNSKTAPKSEQSSISQAAANVETKRKEEQARIEKEKEQLRLQEEKRQAEEAIQKATVLQAPPFGMGTPKDPRWSNIDEFAQRMRDLASNEFKFREAKTTVFRSTFNQKNVNYSAQIKWFLARNAVVAPGNYDFDAGHYSLDLVFWQAIYEENRFGDGPVSPRVEDTCKLRATIKVDAKTAQRWREAFDNSTFSVTIWYRLARIDQGAWKQNPRWTTPMLAHDIVFSVEVLKFE